MFRPPDRDLLSAVDPNRFSIHRPVPVEEESRTVPSSAPDVSWMFIPDEEWVKIPPASHNLHGPFIRGKRRRVTVCGKPNGGRIDMLRIVLIAHDAKKKDMVEWIRSRRGCATKNRGGRGRSQFSRVSFLTPS
jgi:hypothetical protein